MNLTGRLSIAAMVTGVIVFAVLLAVGLVVKKTVHDTILTRLEYDLPDGADDPDYQQCYHSTSGNFANEYYLWNLTNRDEVIQGGTPNYNLTGPFVYTEWYCNYNFTKDDSTGFLRYKQLLQGYRFIADESALDESVLITNINPAYMGVIQQAGDEATLLAVMSGAAVKTIIETFQNQSTVTLIELNSVSQVLPAMNAQILFGMGQAAIAPSVAPTIAGLAVSPYFVTAEQFFGINFQFPVGSVQVLGFYNYTVNTIPSFNAFDINATSLDTIYSVWQNPVQIIAFAQTLNTTIASTYYITVAQAGALLNYLNTYLLYPATYASLGVPEQVLEGFYAQWANASTLTPTQQVINGTLWEIGYPTPSGISAQDVALLFDVTSNCSLVTSVGVQTWMALLADLATAAPPTCAGVTPYTFTPTQFAAVLTWFGNYAFVTAGPLVLEQAGVTNWDDFAYAQWGNLALGVTLGDTATIPFAPELAALNVKTLASFNPSLNLISNPSACVHYDPESAKSLLTGPNGLFNSSCLVNFLTWVSTGDMTAVYAAYPEMNNDFWKPYCLAAYFAYYISFQAVKPTVQAKFIDQNKGMFITRTANEWLFTAEDEFLTYLGQDNDTSLVGNTTTTQEEADQKNFTYYRVYTGHNDLHWSLMPYNEGVVLPFWNGTVNITGYNGTQFLPYDAINDAEPGGYPLILFHHLINRTIPFTKVGKDKWDGVNVVYLTMDPSAVASAAANPVNYLYYSEYQGLINKTSNPPYLPVYLSQADMLGCETAVTENITFSDDIWLPSYDPTDKFSRHRLSLFVLVEPLLGSTVWGNLPIQVNFKVTQGDTSIFYPNVNSHFAPIYWNAIGDIATSSDLNEIKNVLYVGIVAWKALVGVGVGFGVICFVAGVIGFHHHKKHENELKDSSENSMANLKTSSSVSAFSN